MRRNTMSQSQIEVKHPELTGLSHDAQLKILKRARREALPWKSILCMVIISGIVASVTAGLIPRLLSLSKISVGGLVAIFCGASCGVICNLRYAKAFRQKVKILAQDEKQNN